MEVAPSIARSALSLTATVWNRGRLPATELPRALADFFELSGRPAQQAHTARLEGLGLGVQERRRAAPALCAVEALPGT
jgi:hypothetical protein